MLSRIPVVLTLIALPLFAATLPTASPEQVGMSQERLKQVTALAERHIAAGDIAGSVSLIARKGKIVHLEARGLMDLDSKKPMQTNSVFALASMTKPVTSIAVMMLMEQGAFVLNDPISKFLPEFKNPKVAIANAPNERFPNGYKLVAANREITIHDLLTQTAGLASGTSGPTMDLYSKLNAARTREESLQQYIIRLAALPLNFQPGSAWEYGPATDVLGRLVEVVSKESLDQFFKNHIFTPLGMKDTHFNLPDSLKSQSATVYTKSEAGLKTVVPITQVNRNAQYFSGGGGLVGTAEDYLRFAQMLLNGGQLDGKRLVSRKTIESMTSNHIGRFPLWEDTLRGYRFGLGFRVRESNGEAPALGSVGSFGWGGAFGTYFWVDPKEEMIGILMLQLIPYAHLNYRFEFQNVATQAIIN